jgi:hypothetical protein
MLPVDSAFMTSLERPGDGASNWPHGSSIPQPPMPPFRLRAIRALLLCRSVWPDTDPIAHKTTRSAAAAFCLLGNILNVLFYASISALGLRQTAKIQRMKMRCQKISAVKQQAKDMPTSGFSIRWRPAARLCALCVDACMDRS